MRKIVEWSWKDPEGNIHMFETDSLEDLISDIDSNKSCILSWYKDKPPIVK